MIRSLSLSVPVPVFIFIFECRMSTQKSCLIIPELKDVNSLSERRRQVVPGTGRLKTLF